jgi:alanine dehydrogenase
MLVGVPREIKDNEYRVGIVPSTVRELAEKGHQVVIETQAGAGAGFADADYQSAGAEIVPNGAAVFGRAELIVKVKEPLAKNCRAGKRCSPICIWRRIARKPRS